MDYSFLRQLTISMEEAGCHTAFASLSEYGLELYISTEEGSFALVTDQSQLAEAGGILYVASADRKKAVELLEAAGLGECISENIQPVSTQTELERAKQLYYKRRKNGLIAWGIVIAVAFVYYIAKALGMG